MIPLPARPITVRYRSHCCSDSAPAIPKSSSSPGGCRERLQMQTDDDEPEAIDFFFRTGSTAFPGSTHSQSDQTMLNSQNNRVRPVGSAEIFQSRLDMIPDRIDRTQNDFRNLLICFTRLNPSQTRYLLG